MEGYQLCEHASMCTVRVTLDDPPLNCKNDLRVRICTVGGLCEGLVGGERSYFWAPLSARF